MKFQGRIQLFDPPQGKRCYMVRTGNEPLLLLLAFGLFLTSFCGPVESAWAGVPSPDALDLVQMEPELPVGSQAVSELFSSDDVLEFVLASNFDRLKKDRSQESEEIPGKVTFRNSEGEPLEIPIQVKTRGMFRLQRRICPDPPLRLNFPETEAQGTVFDGQDKLKLVTHCRDSDRYEQNLLEEYLAYRLYNHLTDFGFRVQLARVTYMDTSGENDPVTRMAFLIEDEDAMAARLGGLMMEAPTTRPNDFVIDQLSLFYVFQFMIGNVDWGTGASHNAKIVRTDQGYFPIPYDFDFSGLVDSPYAGPSQLTEPFHDSVRERVYWGVCMPGIDYQGVFDRFNQKKDAILNQARDQVGLSKFNAESAVEYLEEFYRIINDPRDARALIIGACRSWLEE